MGAMPRAVLEAGRHHASRLLPARRACAGRVALQAVAAPAGDARDPAGWRRRCAAWHDALEAAIDRDTALVAVEPAHGTDGTRFDLDRLARRARAVRAAFVADATQVAGVMPLDVGALRPDALVVHGYKSMLANYGLGFAVFGDRFADDRATDESWLMRRGSEDFARLVDYQDDYAAGLRRYDTSTRGSPILIGMLEAACRLLVEWQPARIEDYLRRIARPAVERLRADSFGVADEDLRAANLFGIALPPSSRLRPDGDTLRGRRPPGTGRSRPSSADGMVRSDWRVRKPSETACIRTHAGYEWPGRRPYRLRRRSGTAPHSRATPGRSPTPSCRLSPCAR